MSDNDGEECTSSMDLLERARLLCQVANEISLPILAMAQTNVPKPKKIKPNQPPRQLAPEFSSQKSVERVVYSREKRAKHIISDSNVSKKECVTRKSTAPERERISGDVDVEVERTKLPVLQPQKREDTHVDKTKKVRSIKENVESGSTEALPMPEARVTEEWRRQREAERIRQAQERARGRLLKSNQIEHQRRLEPLQENPCVAKPSTETHDINEEKLRHLEEFRRRAEARVRQKRLNELELERKQQESTEVKPSKDMDAFRQKTMQRLKHCKDIKSTADSISIELEPKQASGDEEELKFIERKRRKDTVKRLQRMKQEAEALERREQDRLYQGLQAFRTMRRELDRVAKGPSNNKKTCCIETTEDLDDTMHDSKPQERMATSSPRVAEPISYDSEKEPENDGSVPERLVVQTEEVTSPGLTITLEEREEHYHSISGGAQPSSSIKGCNRKIPPWRQPPVPILPAECYAHKATVLVSPTMSRVNGGESYAQRYQARVSKSSPVPQGLHSSDV